MGCQTYGPELEQVDRCVPEDPGHDSASHCEFSCPAEKIMLPEVRGVRQVESPKSGIISKVERKRSSSAWELGKDMD